MPGRTIIVTGGSRGLGAAIVRSFLESGDRVATCSRSPTETIAEFQADPAYGDRFVYAEVDLSNPVECNSFVTAAAKELGGVDVLVNNAGIARGGAVGLLRPERVDQAIDLNLKGTVAVTRAAVRRMLGRRSGRIINISSIVGQNGYRGLSMYSMTKAGLDGFTRALARELGSRGITVNSVAPGYMKTETDHGLTDRQLEEIAEDTPAGRLGRAEDVTRAVQFLASEEAEFISGHVLVVDGGLTA